MVAVVKKSFTVVSIESIDKTWLSHRKLIYKLKQNKSFLKNFTFEQLVPTLKISEIDVFFERKVVTK